MDNDSLRIPPGLTTEGLLDRRYMARFIDQLLLSLILIAIVVLQGIPLARTRDLGFAYWVTFLLIWIGYGTLLESSPWQATLGKRWMGLRVYNSQGSRPSLLQAAGRNLVKDGPFLALAAISGGQLLSIVWLGAHLAVVHRSPFHQAIHDRILRTWVAVPAG
jgi:uncharacterized RDD family membrane protein YckC